MENAINSSFTLPCGTILNNRIAKAAMTERLADSNHYPNVKLYTLYRKWAAAKAGLMITGNIMVDKHFLEAAGNVVVEDESRLMALQQWAETGLAEGREFWVQLNHPGRQASLFSSRKPLSASDIQLKKMGLFARPIPMSQEQIEDVINRFVNSAKICKKAGFSGVQIHAAHGYLLSQFLSPRTNIREDQWGGSLENRARLLFNIVEKCRDTLGKDYPISVKLNSADFQRGGFEQKDALQVISRLEKLGVDLLEVSGGTYEDLVFLTISISKQSTLEREAYFMDFAREVRKKSRIPLMVTGGFRSLAFCERVLSNGEIDVIGTARPWLLNADFPAGFLNGSLQKVEEVKLKSPFKSIVDMVEGGFYDYQIHRLAHGKELNLRFPSILSALRLSLNEMTGGIFNFLGVGSKI